MNLKQLKPKLNFIKKNTRPILTMVKVTKNSLEVNGSIVMPLKL